MRFISHIVFLLALLGGIIFAAANWSYMLTTTYVYLYFATVRLPLNLIVLGTCLTVIFLQWLVVQGAPAQVWPNVKEFWLEEGYGNGPGQFSYELMAPYMPSGFNPKGLTRADIVGLNVDDPDAQGLVLRGAWTCPSFKTTDKEVIRDMLWRINAYGYMRLRYAYFGRSDLWPEGAATHPEDFGGKEPGSEHLLMTDIQYWYVSADEGLDYNHSINAKKTQEERMTGGVQPGIAGINKLYGDGSASWKDRREYEGPDADPSLLDISSATGRRVRGGESGAAYNACNWY